MSIWDDLKKDKNLKAISNEYTIEELFSDIDIGDQENSNDIMGLADILHENNDEFIFKGTTMDKALSKAAKTLGVNSVELNYKVLEYPKKNIFGLTKSPCVIQIYNDNDEVEAEKDYIDPEKLSKITLAERFKFGVEVHISENTGCVLRKTGQKIDEKGLLDYLKNRTTTYINDPLIYSFIASKDKELFIGEVDIDRGMDYKPHFTTSDDGAIGYINVAAPGLNGCDIEKGDILALLKREGVKEKYINLNALEDIENKKIYNRKILVAKAIKAIHSQNAELLMVVDLKKNIDLENDKLDFKNINPVVNVRKGELLFKKTEIGIQSDGTDIYDGTILARGGVELDISKFIEDGIELRNNETEAYALRDGQLLENSKGMFLIREVMVISGDVGPKTGNIDFIGSLEIRGNILSGYSVKSGGNVTVKQSIENCDVTVDGVLTVQLGINGKNNTIKAKTLYCKFIQDCNLEVGDMYVDETVIRCEIMSSDKIISAGKRASIYDSVIYAQNAISAKTIGNSSGSKLNLKVGYDGLTRKSYEDLSIGVDKARVEIQRVLIDIDEFEKKGPHYIEKFKDRYDVLTQERDRLKPIVDSANDKISALYEKLQQSKNEDAYIEAIDQIYVGTKVTCLDASMEIKREAKDIRYVLNKQNPEYIYIQKAEKKK